MGLISVLKMPFKRLKSAHKTRNSIFSGNYTMKKKSPSERLSEGKKKNPSSTRTAGRIC